jgi:hypothetical protein
VKVRHDEGVAIRIDPEPCGGAREGVVEASVGEHIGQPSSRESLLVLGADVVEDTEGNMSGGAIASTRPTRRGLRPWHVEAPCAGTGRSRVWPAGEYRWPASGRRGVEADDVRTREVGLCHSSDEASEQSRATAAEQVERRAGTGGERGPAKHAPGTEPEKRVTGAGPRAESRNNTWLAARYPR